MRNIWSAIVLMLIAFSSCWASVPAGSEAQYFLQSSSERQTVPLHRIRIVAGKTEKVSGKTYQWWEMTLEKPGGEVMGIRVLSERVPMTSTDGAGKIARYVFSPASGECFEYQDQLTGNELLPIIDNFNSDFLPRVFEYSRYTDGFANSGRLLGHILVRSNNRPDFQSIDFSHPNVLRMRSDLRITIRWEARDDRDESIPMKKRVHTALARDEYEELMSVGVNVYDPAPDIAGWIKTQPVYFGGQCCVYPDDFYRSNYIAAEFAMDEPGVRFGWDNGVPGTIMSPDIAANAIAMRVEQLELASRRTMSGNQSWQLGAMDAVYNRIPSWDTNLTFINYELLGGASELVYEGRYVKHGYGWAPEKLLGEGCDTLADKQQYDYSNALLRGAARQQNAHWGISVYPEGDVSMMLPALIRGYDQGARSLWFWNDTNLPYKQCVKVLRGLNEHIESHPRTPAVARARVGIVLPKGYMLTENGVYGMPREQLSEGGASYGDISATALFEGILCSRAGIEYDYINDHPGIDKLGYEQLIYVREDGKLEFSPRRLTKSAPNSLEIELKPKDGKSIVDRATSTTDYIIPRSTGVEIDGNLQDWANASWIPMSGEPYLFGDNYNAQLQIEIPETATPKSDQAYLGFTWEGISTDYRTKYRLEGWQPSEVVVTSIKPDSAASAAGLREGDIIRSMDGRQIHWGFELWNLVRDLKTSPGKTVDVQITRGGLDHVNGAADLSAKIAFMLDDRNLYFAADVTDDVQQQTMRGPDSWMNDSIQIGFDPTLVKSYGYGENEHEIGCALQNGKPMAYRWQGRRGQPLGEMNDVRTAIERTDGKTIYETAIPLSELTPLSPDMWHQAGICVVINDSDDGKTRKARLELSTGALTAGKKLDRFPVFELEPSKDLSKVSAAILWNKRCISLGGSAEVTIAVSSPATTRAKIVTKLSSLDDSDTKPAMSETSISVTSAPREFTLSVSTKSQPGRYRLMIEVLSPDGSVVAKDALPVYVYR